MQLVLTKKHDNPNVVALDVVLLIRSTIDMRVNAVADMSSKYIDRNAVVLVLESDEDRDIINNAKELWLACCDNIGFQERTFEGADLKQLQEQVKEGCNVIVLADVNFGAVIFH